MKQAGGDDFVRLPIRAQQRTNLDRMGDKRRAAINDARSISRY